MANEFKHKDPGSELTQAEFISACGDGHIFACQATGDILYASSSTVLSKLAKGAANTVLSMGGSCIPAWTASPSVTDLTIGGGCITLSAATDIDLLDNNASALSFDATGKTGIIDIVTTNCSEGVTMSGTLGVTGVLTATGGIELSHACQNTLTGSGGCISVNCNVIYRAGGTDVAVADGGTGASSLTDGGILLGSGTNAITAMAVLADGEMIVGDGTTDPVAESGATLRTSIGVGTGDSPQFTGIELGHASDTTIARSGSGDITIEGNAVYRAGGTDVALADGGTGASLSDPGADRILFWDDSEGTIAFLVPNCNLAISGTNLNACGGGGGGGACALQVNDSVAVALGTGSDSQIYYNGSDTYWDLQVVGTGGLTIARGDSAPAPDNDGIHLWKATAGCITANAVASDLIIESNCNAGIQFLTPNDKNVYLLFGDPCANNVGRIIYGHSSNVISFYTAGAHQMSIGPGYVRTVNGTNSAPAYSFNCTTGSGIYRPTACSVGFSIQGTERMRLDGWELRLGEGILACNNSKMAEGLTISQADNDNEIFAIKSSDVAHGVTCRAETDTFGYFQKTGAANGGLGITGITEYSGYGVVLSGITCGDNTTKGTGGVGQVMVQALKKSGSSTASAGSDANLFVIQAGGSTTRFIFDAEGTAHADVGTATYDDYCDVELLRGMLATTCDQYRQNYMDRFGTDLMYNQQWYEDNKIIGKDSIHYETRECGRVQQRAMINFTGLTMLHHSTIIQLADRLNDRIDGIETQLQALSEGK